MTSRNLAVDSAEDQTVNADISADIGAVLEVEAGGDPAADTPSRASGSQLIRKMLSPAVRLWLRSQVESIGALHFEISGGDRQLLQGNIPQVAVRGEQAVYQGLHLTYLDLSAEQIQINLRQILRGKPLRLLQVVPVSGTVRVTQADLDRSVGSPLLQQALIDLLKQLLADIAPAPAAVEGLKTQAFSLENPRLQLGDEQLTLTAIAVMQGEPLRDRALPPQTLSPQTLPLKLCTQLRLVGGSMLQLTATTLQTQTGLETHFTPLPDRAIDLGTAVHLQQLTIAPQQIDCVGQISIVPAEMA